METTVRRQPRRHQFVVDPELRDERTGEQWCLCGLPADNQIHTVPERSDEERATEARRVGEGHA